MEGALVDLAMLPGPALSVIVVDSWCRHLVVLVVRTSIASKVSCTLAAQFSISSMATELKESTERILRSQQCKPEAVSSHARLCVQPS